MVQHRVLVANRGEIALRLLRAAEDLGMEAVTIASEDDAQSLHARATKCQMLKGRGAKPYLDIEQLVQAAYATGCTAVAPGYGFLSESPEFCRAVLQAGLVFIGPPPEALELFGDKVRSREFAQQTKVPVIPGRKVDTAAQVKQFFDEQKGRPLMLKASHGGGGKGMRVIKSASDISAAFERGQSESLASFGSNEMFVELLLTKCKHIEIQILADQMGNVVALGERECSVQRANQKLIEMSPCPTLRESTRQALYDASIKLAKQAGIRGLSTMEFMLDVTDQDRWYFIECNPRLQVEHTVTEEAWGIDLVSCQFATTVLGKPLSDFNLPKSSQRFAMQLRVNTETVLADGSCKPDFGRVSFLALPHGPGVRVDSAADIGDTNPNFDSLFAKIVVSGWDFQGAIVRADRALREFAVIGVRTNASFLRAVLAHALFRANADLTTRFVSEHAPEIVAAAANLDARSPARRVPKSDEGVVDENAQTPEEKALSIICPIHGEVVSISVRPGDRVREGQSIAVLTAFKMEHEIMADKSGVVAQVLVNIGTVCRENQTLVVLEYLDKNGADSASGRAAKTQVDLDTYTRPELDMLRERRKILEDDFRRDKIAKRRHAKGKRSAMENVLDIVDEGSYVEYGSLAIAHQLGRRELDDLIQTTQRDGIVCGIGHVNGQELADGCSTSCGVVSYDYLVIAGTQGARGHQKKDRLFLILQQYSLPLIMFTEGGGGRPNDFSVDGSTSGLGVPTWHALANMNGVKIGVASGYNFAGNAALLGMCDIIIATQDASIAMAGPVMVEHAGLGKPDPNKLGAAPMQFRNGVVHLLASDEVEATRMSKKVLSYFQGRAKSWECDDQRALRATIPDDRKRSYDVRSVIETLADRGSVMELSSAFGKSAVTALVRIEGWPIGLIANQPLVLGGAMDADGCEKLACFLQLCERFRLPVLTLCDTPGFIVGEAFEKTGLVKYTSKVFNVGSRLTVPKMTILLRKGFGLGAMAMTGGGIQLDQLFCVAWPTGELGPMGLEGAVQLAFKKELEAIEDPQQRQELFDLLVSKAYERSNGFSVTNNFELDSVIDPSESRFWIVRALESARHKQSLAKL